MNMLIGSAQKWLFACAQVLCELFDIAVNVIEVRSSDVDTPVVLTLQPSDSTGAARGAPLAEVWVLEIGDVDSNVNGGQAATGHCYTVLPRQGLRVASVGMPTGITGIVRYPLLAGEVGECCGSDWLQS